MTDFTSITGGGIRGRVEGHAIFIGSRALLEKSGLTGFEAMSDHADGLLNEGRIVIWVGQGNAVIGFIALSDQIKSSTPQAIRRLHELGLRVVMLTGDNARTARHVAETLGIDEVKAQVSPQDKQTKITELKKAGALVAMAGDGVNDAPALASADVGIAMGTGTDVAMHSAGVTLVKGDLLGIAQAIELSRATMVNIRQNLFFAFLYNGLGIPIAAGVLYPFFGLLLSPIIASAAMSLSSVCVIGNALRLKGVKL